VVVCALLGPVDRRLAARVCAAPETTQVRLASPDGAGSVFARCPLLFLVTLTDACGRHLFRAEKWWTAWLFNTNCEAIR